MPNYYISQVTLPDGITYDIKDAQARADIQTLQSMGIKFGIGWDGQSMPDITKIPSGVTVTWQDTDYTGTLSPSTTDPEGHAIPYPEIVLIHGVSGTGKNIYDEYAAVSTGDTVIPYIWEKIGNTDINVADLGALAYKDTVTLNKGSGDQVLGESTTFTNSTSEVTMNYGTTAGFVKSYPGVTSKLSTTTVTGVSGSTSASKATAGTTQACGNADVDTAVNNIALAASAATSVSYIGNAQTDYVITTATVSGEVLTIGRATVSQGAVWGVKTKNSGADADTTSIVPAKSAAGTITPYTFDDVTVPIAAASATTVATGSLSNEATGASVMTGLGTATTESAVTSIGSGSSTATGTAAAQTVTVGTNDKVKVAIYDDLGVTVS